MTIAALEHFFDFQALEGENENAMLGVYHGATGSKYVDVFTSNQQYPGCILDAKNLNFLVAGPILSRSWNTMGNELTQIILVATLDDLTHKIHLI